MPGGELERVLASIFPEQTREKDTAALGDVDPGLVANTQQVPGITYQGGPQPQRGGLVGRSAQAYSDWINGVYGGVDPAQCPPPFNSPDCMDVLSRLLETTFRGFQLTARPPSHIAPPLAAQCIDCFGSVLIPGIPYGTSDFTKVCCFSVPSGRWRGVVVDFGHALESLAAWADVEWRVTVNGQPHEPYISMVGFQVWHMINQSKGCRIHLSSQDTVCLEARSLSTTSHFAYARILGWYYPVRSETGGGREVRATLVD